VIYVLFKIKKRGQIYFTTKEGNSIVKIISWEIMVKGKKKKKNDFLILIVLLFSFHSRRIESKECYYI
jgi:hypothetical protein